MDSRSIAKRPTTFRQVIFTFTDIQKTILERLLTAQTPVSNKDLAHRCDTSINSIRKELRFINQELGGHGLAIRSRTSLGP